MANQEKFLQEINEAFATQGEYFVLGGAMLDGEPLQGAQVKVPLRMLNRHGLIAGATGTGKTKTLQSFAEALSARGIPSLMMDIKGDLSGLAAPGEANEKIEQRHAHIGVPWQPEAFPVELLSISNDAGTRLRATVSEFGPVLFSKILELNDTQSGVVSLVFKFADDKGLPLLDLKDFKKVLQYLTNEGKKEIEADYGRISTASTSTILRKIVEIEQQGADTFFGEVSFDVDDLLRVDERGYGYISLLRVTDIQDKPKLFSTFMLSLLAEIYASFPEEGDLEQPKLVIFIDEAHLVFQEASQALQEQLESIIKLIRSKGVGVFFCTQQPMDVPASVLGQLGMKVQHALRAFTAQDRKQIKTVAENYPLSEYYQTDQLLTELGIGEALVTLLREDGTPGPLVHTLLCAPHSRMGTLSDAELQKVLSASQLAPRYNQAVDRDSAYEILMQKLQSAPPVQNSPTRAPAPQGYAPQGYAPQQQIPVEQSGPSIIGEVFASPIGQQVGRQVARTAASIVTRELLGALGLSSRRRRRSLF
jgi:DNA helicase HerA-like ATPase